MIFRRRKSKKRDEFLQRIEHDTNLRQDLVRRLDRLSFEMDMLRRAKRGETP